MLFRSNNSATQTATNVLITDPPVANIAKVSATCTASINSVCPGSVPLLTFESPGVVAPLIAPSGNLTITLVATPSGSPGNTATNGVTVSSNDYIDTNLANNLSTVSNVINGSADLRISKTNGGTSVVAGATTAYTLTVSNFGPSTVVGAVMKDPVAAGLSCTSITCTGVTGATSCPAGAATTIPALQGAGIAMPSMISPASISFLVICGVTATGQ